MGSVRTSELAAQLDAMWPALTATLDAAGMRLPQSAAGFEFMIRLAEAWEVPADAKASVLRAAEAVVAASTAYQAWRSNPSDDCAVVAILAFEQLEEANRLVLAIDLDADWAVHALNRIQREAWADPSPLESPGHTRQRIGRFFTAAEFHPDNLEIRGGL